MVLRPWVSPGEPLSRPDQATPRVSNWSPPSRVGGSRARPDVEGEPLQVPPFLGPPWHRLQAALEVARFKAEVLLFRGTLTTEKRQSQAATRPKVKGPKGLLVVAVIDCRQAWPTALGSVLKTGRAQALAGSNPALGQLACPASERRRAGLAVARRSLSESRPLHELVLPQGELVPACDPTQEVREGRHLGPSVGSGAPVALEFEGRPRAEESRSSSRDGFEVGTPAPDRLNALRSGAAAECPLRGYRSSACSEEAW